MICLDTSFLVELIIADKPHHEKAHELKNEFHDEGTLINTTIFTEVLNKLKVNKGHPNYEEGVYKLLQVNNQHLSYNEVLNQLFDFLLHDVECHWLTYDDYVQSFMFYKTMGGSINYSDCTILQSMTVNNVRTVASYDTDFDKIKWINRIYLE